MPPARGAKTIIPPIHARRTAPKVVAPRSGRRRSSARAPALTISQVAAEISPAISVVQRRTGPTSICHVRHRITPGICRNEIIAEVRRLMSMTLVRRVLGPAQRTILKISSGPQAVVCKREIVGVYRLSPQVFQTGRQLNAARRQGNGVGIVTSHNPNRRLAFYLRKSRHGGGRGRVVVWNTGLRRVGV